MSPYILFGLYYGLLATLPVGPSQFLCIRSFLLGGNLAGLASLSGLMLAQLATTISIYYSPIYILLLKPHLLTIVVIPYMVVFCLTINDLPNYEILRPVTSLRDLRVVSLFFNSFLCQILNPILLPNPVLTRLTHLLFFRYSTNSIFVITSFLGWLSGHIMLSYLSKLLLIRVEKDSPIIYLLVKRAIYTTFSIVFVLNAVIYLGRAPVSFSTIKFLNESHDKEMSFWDIAEYPYFLWWFFKPWPTSFFDPSRGNRGNRFIKNSRFNLNSSFYKVKTSTYFFKKCLTDGKQRLCIAALPSLSIFEKRLEKALAGSRKFAKTYSSYRGWILHKLVKNKIFQKKLRDQVKLLDTGSLFSKAMERKIRLISRSKRRVPYVYDPCISNLRVRIPVPQTFLTTDELSLTSWDWTELQRREKTRRGTDAAITKKNLIEDQISFTSGRRLRWWGSRTPLPWEPLPAKARRIFQFMFKNRVLYDYDVQKILRKIKSPSGSVVTWEEIMNLDPEDRALFLTYIKEEENCYKFDRIFLSNRFLIKGRKRPLNPKKGVRTLHKIDDLSADLARNNEQYFDTEFDFPGADGDIRHRKLRNVGFTFAKGRPRSTKLVKLVKRYARISDFRRKFLKGSMRSRRRKTLLWKALQEKVRSAFFLRLMEIPILLKLPVEQLTGATNKKSFTNSKDIIDYQFGQQLTTSSLTNKTLSQLKLDRSAVAARSDIGPIHNGRGYMLVFQSKFRKFIKLPVLIVFKTIGRILLRQSSEWNKDWTKWKKEIHINCTFDGEEFSQDQLPPRWLREGIQIKIVYPFQLKPWHSSGKKKRLTPRKKYLKADPIEDQKLKNKHRLKQKRPRFTYLTALGYQTDIPFGSIQKQPSFWRPVRKELIRTCREGFSLGTKQVYRFLDSKFNFGKMLKPSLILFKELNLFFKSKGVSADPVSTSNTTIRPVFTSNTNQLVELNLNLDKEKNGGSFTVGAEVQLASDKQSVSQKSKNNKFLANSSVTGLPNLLNVEVDLNKPDTETTQVDELDLNENATLKDTDLANFLKFDEEELKSFKEMTLKLHILIEEAIEKYFLVTSISYIKVNRFFCYYFNEFVALHTQLVEVMNATIRETNLVFPRSKNRLLWFGKNQWLPQAYLYKSIWDLGVKKDLNLNLLATGSKGSREEDVKSYEGQSGKRTPYQSEQFLAYSEDFSKLSIRSNSNTSRSTEISNYTDISFDKATTKKAKELFSEQILKCIEEWGVLKKLCDLDANDWNKWLDCFSEYNLPITLWRNVAPYRWRNNSDCLNELSYIKKIADEQEYNALQGEPYNYSIYTKKPLLRDRVRNLSRLRKRRYLLKNIIDFVRNGDIQNFSIRQDAATQRFYCESRISKMTKVRGRGINRVSDSCVSDSEIKFNSKFDLMPWLVTDFARAKGRFTKKIERSSDPIFKDNTIYGIVLDISRRFQKVSDELYEIMLDEREDTDYLFRWKCKSEVKLENLRSLIALARMLGDDGDLVTLCANTGVDSELLDLYFNTRTKLGLFHNLSIISAHRLPILLDDQNLVYKMINPLLKFKSRLKNRVKKRLYRKIYSDTYISKLSCIAAEVTKKRSHIYNIGDLLLPRRRREFRFLRSLLISRSRKPRAHYFDSKFDPILKFEQTRGNKDSDPSELKEVQKVKRFLWPSYRLEELACTGRFCFNITTGSQFTMLKIRMYPINRN